MSLLLVCRFWAVFLTTPRDVVKAKAGVQMQSTRVKYKVCSLWEHLSQLGMLPPPLLCPGCVFGWAVALRVTYGTVAAGEASAIKSGAQYSALFTSMCCIVWIVTL